jgi:hypothetical protein|tara:strand:- start:3284 stop:3472 length:189 start_codon:yes stop_codon:yes gene_type:complete
MKGYAMKKVRNQYQKDAWNKGHVVEPDKKKQASKDWCDADVDILHTYEDDADDFFKDRELDK